MTSFPRADGGHPLSRYSKETMVMHNIKQNVGQVVASDTQASIAALDAAVLMQARLCASTIEAASDSRLPVAATQGLLESLAEGIEDLVQGRAKLAQAVRHINLIQRKSNLRATSFGCPNGWGPMSESEHDVICVDSN